MASSYKAFIASVSSLLVLSIGCLSAVELEAPRTSGKKTKAQAPELQQNDLEDKWIFEPPVARIDPFYDRETVLRLEAEYRQQQEKDSTEPGAAQADPNKDIILYATAEQARIESLMANKKFDDAMKSSDIALKRLEKHADLPDIQAAITRITAYRDQADEAITRNEAQAQFDSLGLRIEGILWSEGGSRLAIIAGEPRAIGINERVKDCVIINIDTDRVDFRFHYKRKRFEFPRYVGEDPKNLAAQTK